MRRDSIPFKLLFWISTSVVAYTWVLYPLALKLLLTFRPRSQPRRAEYQPSASVVLLAHNEEHVIRAALDDLVAMEYPRDLVEFIVVCDGCTDGTEQVVASYPDSRVRLVSIPRSGVTAGLARGVVEARNEVVVRTDADTRHRKDYLRELLKPYQDPKVGCVGGAFRFENVDANGITRSEGLYWKFEMYLRRAESELGILSTTSSAVMSFRRELFEAFSPVHSEDVVVPKLVVKRGYKVVQQPSAIAYELMPRSMEGQIRARRRMVARGITAVFSEEGALNPLTHPGHWVSLMTHKPLRWATPIFLLVSFLGAAGASRTRLYRLALLGHLSLYVSAALGYYLDRRRLQLKPFSAAFSFCLANVSFLVGLWDAACGRRVSSFASQD